MKKRLLAILLVMVLIVSLLPSSALAERDEQTDAQSVTLQENGNDGRDTAEETEDTADEPPLLRGTASASDTGVDYDPALGTVTAEGSALKATPAAGAAFLGWVNADTGKVCVLYQRKDGDYGLLEPEN